MRRNRYIEVGSVYEIVSRAEHSIPFAPTRTTVELRRGILGRAWRKKTCILLHATDMSNHGHYMCLAEDEAALSNFCQDINKRATDTIKVLLGFERLSLWEERPNIAELPEYKDALEKVCYIYLNPAEAGLVDSIDEYPGFTTWQAFLTCPADVDACVEEKVRYYFKRALKRLPASNTLDPYADIEYLHHLKQQEVRTGRVNIVSEEVLQIKPFAFLKRFGITAPEEVAAFREEVKRRVYTREAELRAERAAQNRPVIGAERLRRSEYMQEHTPKERRPKVAIITGNAELRATKLAAQTAVFEECRSLRKLAIEGEQVEWPEKVYIPWLPPRRSRDKNGGAASALKKAGPTPTGPPTRAKDAA